MEGLFNSNMAVAKPWDAGNVTDNLLKLELLRQDRAQKQYEELYKNESLPLQLRLASVNAVKDAMPINWDRLHSAVPSTGSDLAVNSMKGLEDLDPEVFLKKFGGVLPDIKSKGPDQMPSLDEIKKAGKYLRDKGGPPSLDLNNMGRAPQNIPGPIDSGEPPVVPQEAPAEKTMASEAPVETPAQQDPLNPYSNLTMQAPIPSGGMAGDPRAVGQFLNKIPIQNVMGQDELKLIEKQYDFQTMMGRLGIQNSTNIATTKAKLAETVQNNYEKNLERAQSIMNKEQFNQYKLHMDTMVKELGIAARPEARAGSGKTPKDPEYDRLSKSLQKFKDSAGKWGIAGAILHKKDIFQMYNSIPDSYPTLKQDMYSSFKTALDTQGAVAPKAYTPPGVTTPNSQPGYRPMAPGKQKLEGPVKDLGASGRFQKDSVSGKWIKLK